jgi:hypothetical protein
VVTADKGYDSEDNHLLVIAAIVTAKAAGGCTELIV